MLPLSPASRANGIDVHATAPTVIEFDGQVYAMEQAAVALTKIAEDETVELARRERALDELGKLGAVLADREEVTRIMGLYERTASVQLRREALLCLGKSNDRRALPLFKKALATDSDTWSQLLAAGALSKWNERSGVRRLVELLRSDVIGEGGSRGNDHAARLLNSGNHTGLWGFPSAEVYEVLRGIEDESVRADVFATKWEEWFMVNEGRFPELEDAEERDRAEESSEDE